MKTAIVYDRVNKWGGAERVLLALHEIFPDAPLYTSVYSPEKAPWAKVFPKVITSFVQNVPFAKDKHEHFPYLMPLAFESFSAYEGFDEYDLVISVTSEAAKGIITKPSTLHICYCLTPTRYLWSHYDFYFKGSPFRTITRPVVWYLREWDKLAAQRPDVMVGISTTVQERIKKYYQRESEFIYPPVDIQKFAHKRVNNSTTALRSTVVGNTEYYLYVSRLIPYKRAELAVKVFNELGLPLVVVGTGSEEGRLKSIAKSNVSFVGYLTDEELAFYYQNAQALVFPGEEDFGLVMVEAQAAGCPVIAYKKGGALDIVIDGKTGILFGKQNVESLKKAVNNYDDSELKAVIHHRSIEPRNCIENAQRFSKERFKKEFLDIVQKYKI